MKKLLAVLMFAALLFIPSLLPSAKAQTRWLIGTEGVAEFDNYSIGIVGAVEIPFAKHFELDLKDTFSPIESHVALGSGRANQTSADGIVWLNKSIGLIGGADDSMYDVTHVTKDADYASGGLMYRGIIGGAPTRFTFEYIRQFNNGITPSGLESSHLQGGAVGFTMRFGCVGAVCVRNSEQLVFGRVLTQGNPQCDGTYGVTGGPNGGPCPRTAAFGGGVNGSISLEFPRHRGHEHDVF